VFTYRDRPVERINNSGWRTAWRAAGLPTGKEILAGPHNLRHTFARRLRLAGVPLETRKALLHHLDGDITVHYSPAEIRELIEAVEKLKETETTTLLRAVR
jgi:integrase